MKKSWIIESIQTNLKPLSSLSAQGLVLILWVYKSNACFLIPQKAAYCIKLDNQW